MVCQFCLILKQRVESMASLHAFSITAIHCWQRSARLVLTMALRSCEKLSFIYFVHLMLAYHCELISRCSVVCFLLVVFLNVWHLSLCCLAVSRSISDPLKCTWPHEGNAFLNVMYRRERNRNLLWVVIMIESSVSFNFCPIRSGHCLAGSFFRQQNLFCAVHDGCQQCY